MNDISEYLRIKLEAFRKEHDVPGKLNRYDGDIKRRWMRDREETRKLWQEIMSVSDVYDYVDRYVFSVENEVKLNVDYLDIYDTDLALYRVTYAIDKMVQCYNNDLCQFKTIDKNSIDMMFEKLEQAYRKMQDELTRRRMR